MTAYIGFVGCYTLEGQADPFEGDGGVPHDRSKVGEGVHAISVTSEGKLAALAGPIIGADTLQNPAYVTILKRSDATGRPDALKQGGLCVVSELSEGTFQAFAIECEGSEVKAKAVGSRIDSGGQYPCHITSDTVGDMEVISVCNYGDSEGVLSLYGNNSNVGNPYIQHVRIAYGAGSKIDLARQATSHAHSSEFTDGPSLSKKNLCVLDLGSDKLISYSLSTEISENSLKCTEQSCNGAPPGTGPRSIMFNPKYENIAAISLEMSAQILLVERKGDGSFVKLLKPIPLLPAGWPDESSNEAKYNGGKWASDAVFSPCGRFLYAAARLHNSISVFELKISSEKHVDGIDLVQRIPTEGLTPRCLCVPECGAFILVAHQHSHEITSFSRSKDDGHLELVDRLEFPNAACVKLVKRDMIG